MYNINVYEFIFYITLVSLEITSPGECPLPKFNSYKFNNNNGNIRYFGRRNAMGMTADGVAS